ncbi:hypothetical protein T09_13796 [Trichinella sp. T9]|nr:hypothetical protein T09_13796 [Trichinella sp. T9]
MAVFSNTPFISGRNAFCRTFSSNLAARRRVKILLFHPVATKQPLEPFEFRNTGVGHFLWDGFARSTELRGRIAAGREDCECCSATR